MWVKICANTSLADARLAADLGADAIGFVFAPSRRRVTPDEVAAITPLLPATLERIGVFDRGTPGEIVAAAQVAGLTGIQLHGAFPPSFHAEFDRRNGGRFDIIHVVHWQQTSPHASTHFLKGLQTLDAGTPLARLLVDTAVYGADSGGTGVSFSWADAAAALARLRSERQLIVAGGLHADNVASAIRTLEPWGVDVASGVEARPGVKDAEKLRAFLTAARSAREASSERSSV